MLSKGFIKSKDEVVETIPIEKGTIDSVNVYSKSDIAIINKKSDKDINYDYEVKLNKINLPINSGSIVGTINIKYNDKIIKSEDLIIKDDIEKVNYIKYLLNKLLNVL